MCPIRCVKLLLFIFGALPTFSRPSVTFYYTCVAGYIAHDLKQKPKKNKKTGHLATSLRKAVAIRAITAPNKNYSSKWHLDINNPLQVSVDFLLLTFRSYQNYICFASPCRSNLWLGWKWLHTKQTSPRIPGSTCPNYLYTFRFVFQFPSIFLFLRLKPF